MQFFEIMKNDEGGITRMAQTRWQRPEFWGSRSCRVGATSRSVSVGHSLLSSSNLFKSVESVKSVALIGYPAFGYALRVHYMHWRRHPPISAIVYPLSSILAGC